MKTVFGRSELGLSGEEDDMLVNLRENWGTVVPIHAFPDMIQADIIAKAADFLNVELGVGDNFSIDAMDF